MNPPEMERLAHKKGRLRVGKGDRALCSLLRRMLARHQRIPYGLLLHVRAPALLRPGQSSAKEPCSKQKSPTLPVAEPN